MDEHKPVPSLEWMITDRCNYRCEYCCQDVHRRRKFTGHCSDALVETMLSMIEGLEGIWNIKLVGGEPFIHPRFWDICERIAKRRHDIDIVTNFSLPMKQLERFIEVCGTSLNRITASLHLSQVKDLEEFKRKAIRFNQLKHPATSFSITTVMLEEDFERLQKLYFEFMDQGVDFIFQILKNRGVFHQYPPPIEEFMAGKKARCIEEIRDKNLFGTRCYTGKYFFVIGPKGDVRRCYNPQPWFSIGNILKGTFKPFSEPKPCLSKRCSCNLPAVRKMICYGTKEKTGTIGYEYIVGFVKEFPNEIIRKKNRCKRFVLEQWKKIRKK